MWVRRRCRLDRLISSDLLPCSRSSLLSTRVAASCTDHEGLCRLSPGSSHLASGLSMSTSEFVATPTHQDLTGTKDWLEEERLKEGHSFICNWKAIEESFIDSKAFCLRLNGQPVGFVAWEYAVSNKVVELLIAAVKPEIRRQGYGGELARQSLSLFRLRGIRVVQVECMPPQSEGFWRHHGFVDFPEEYYPGQKTRTVRLFRSLADGVQPMSTISRYVRMQLWHKSIHDAQGLDAASAEIQLEIDKNGDFINELAIPAMPDWKVCLTFPDGTTKINKVKYLFSGSCFEDGFIVGVPKLA